MKINQRWLHFHDEGWPKIGSGRRWCNVRLGRKWVYAQEVHSLTPGWKKLKRKWFEETFGL